MVKHPTTRRVGWGVALAAAVAAAVGSVIYFGNKSAAAATPKAAPPGPAPANTVPVWTALTPVANPSAPGSFMVAIPAGASFAFSDSASDPNLTSIVAGLNAAVSAGTVTAPVSYADGSAAPSFWPNDGLGTSGFRASGVASSAFNLGLGPLGATSPTTAPQVWIVSGFTAA